MVVVRGGSGGEATSAVIRPAATRGWIELCRRSDAKMSKLFKKWSYKCIVRQVRKMGGFVQPYRSVTEMKKDNSRSHLEN